MTKKINWDRQPIRSILDSEYYKNPKTGFDSEWHTQQKFMQDLTRTGKHQNHIFETIKLSSGPHSGKIICKTCNDKFIKWVPKNLL